MAETIYPKGIITFAKNEKAPDFILGTVVISLNEFIEWAKANPQLLTEYNGQKQLKLQCLTKKSGGISLSVDTFKPEKKVEPNVSQHRAETQEIINQHELPEDVSDILPF